MKQGALFFLCSMLASAGFASAQGKAVTNSDLEKFKQKREQAEQGLREYYSKLGLSEEDVAKQAAADAKAREELSARLRANRLEQERIDAEARVRQAEAKPPAVNVVVQEPGYGYTGYFTHTNPYYGRRGRWVRPPRYPITWRATPMGVIYEPGSLPASIWTPRVLPRIGQIRQPPRNPSRRLQ